MTESTSDPSNGRARIGLLFLCALACVFLVYRAFWPRGEALGAALTPLIEKKDTDQSLVASVIWDNYRETRRNASRWSGIYWGCTFAAAALSALAGLILKFERILENAELRRDLAAAFAVGAALLITISSSGDFQRKWQANRMAAAELERTGYGLLERDGTDARSALAAVGETLLRRHMAIVGGAEKRKPPADATDGTTPGN